MLLVGNWSWINKLSFCLIIFFTTLVYAKYFYVESFLRKQGYRTNFDLSEGPGTIVFKKIKSSSIEIEFKVYNHFFRINQHFYYLSQVPLYADEGIALFKKDEANFKKILAFYERKSSQDKEKIPTLSVNKDKNSKDLSSPKKTNPIASPTQKKVNQKNLENLTYYETKKNKINFIFLDPGHGGKDPGAVFYAFKEKDLALKLTLKLYRILKQQAGNLNILITRDKDKYLSLENRTHLANSALKENDNGIFISIHLNIWLNPNTRGMEVYYLGDDADLFDRRVENLFILENNIGSKDYNQEYLKKIFSYFKIVQFQSESLFLAEKIIANTYLKVKDYPIDRGVKKETFYVLNGTLMPAILLELGFISNRADIEFLLNEEKSNLLLEAIASSILTYVKEFNRTNGFSDELFILR